MSDRYPGGIITKTPVTPAGPYAEGSAPGVWTLEQQAYWAAQGLWPNASNPAPNDPYFQYVTSLLHGDGTNGGQNNTFLDSSTNAFTITRNGNTTQGSFSPYGSNWGNYFNGSSYLTVGSSNQVLPTGTQDFSVEFWVYPLSFSGSYPLFLYNNTSGGFQIVYEVSSGKLAVGASGVGLLVDFVFSGSLNTWSHIVATRSGNSFRIFQNGVLKGYNTSSNSFSATATQSIGADSGGGYSVNSYISNLRTVLGSIPLAYQTSSTTTGATIFTSPTSPLSVVSGTALLTCQSNRFIDNSSNAFSLTIGGTPQVTRFSPFAPTYATQYSASTIGGSGYFDGSGDYLTFPNQTATNLGSSDFTIEYWYYPTGTTQSRIISQRNSGSQYGMLIASPPADTLVWYVPDTASSFGVTLNGGSNYAVQNAWNHVAVSRSGSTWSLYLNGNRVGTTTASFSVYNNSSSPWYIGVDGGDITYIGTGYISDVRLVKGTALYTGTTYTIPTSPLTAVSNTSLLTNMTNGAIYDNAMIPDYETVGNAQISTSVKKYGTGSLAFDGTGDWLTTTVPATGNLALGYNNMKFTVEFWMYSTSSANGAIIEKGGGFGGWNSTNGINWVLNKYSTNTLRWQWWTGSTNGMIETGFTVSQNTWYHIAIAYDGTTTKIFVNGTQVASGSTTYGVPSASTTLRVGAETDGSIPFVGYVDDLRITSGYVRYWENFTPPAAALPNFGGAYQVPTQDPQFNYTTLLLPGNGTNGAQNNTFLDSSTNAFTITRNGNTTQGTFTPFSQTGWANYFGTGNYLDVGSSNTSVSFGTSDFTIEGWFYFDSLYSESALLWGKNVGWTLYNYPNGYLQWGTTSPQSPANLLTSTIGIREGTWQHIAVTRSSNTVSLWINGNFAGSVSDSSNYSASGNLEIGRSHSSESLKGYASNVRVTKGAALYTANFTPSTTPLTTTVSSGTVSVLTCQSNRFIDNSTNAYTITVNGSPSVQAFSPFAPTAAYSASTVGGSGYFDGNGDSLSTTSLSSSITGDFTVEGFVYLTEAFSAVTHTIFGPWNTPANNFLFRISTGGALQLYMAGSLVFSSAATFKPNEWVHLAISRSSGTLKCFVNGVEFFSGSNSSTVNLSTFIVGAETTSSTTGDIWKGYISNVRVSQTTARYTAAFTPPTAPFTNDASTTLLLSCTNAGITDATAKNNLETVGNAQISTTQSKFGGSSIYFDGTGDWLTCSQPINLPASSDFTIEGWFYLTAAQADFRMIMGESTGGSGQYFGIGSTGILFQTGATSGTQASFAYTFSQNTWYHIAVSRYGNTIYCFVNGNSLSGTNTSQSAAFLTSTSYIGVGYSSSYPWNGYMQDVRITKGYARYVQPFTPPAQADQLY